MVEPPLSSKLTAFREDPVGKVRAQVLVAAITERLQPLY
jgi:hypothetical protein